MAGVNPPDITTSTVGRPALSAVRDPLVRRLSDGLYSAGQTLLMLSRAVERREVTDYLTRADEVGSHLLTLVVLCGELASIDELSGGRLHGTTSASFPPADAQTQERLAQFAATRALERTVQRPWPEYDDDDPEEGA